MAGDWIPMRMDLAEDPAVIQIAAATGMDEFAVVGRLHRLWSWANRHLSSGDASGVTEPWIDRYVSAPGFAAALLAAGWLRLRSGGVSFPNFDRWNSQGAKRRVLTAQRMKRSRDAKCDATSVTSASPEKRREEYRNAEDPPNPPQTGGASADQPPVKVAKVKRTDTGGESVPLPPELDVADFREVWADWLVDRKARGKKVTAKAAGLQLGSLTGLGPERAAACVKQSIAKGWTGLFPDRFRPQPAPAPVVGASVPRGEDAVRLVEAMRKAPTLAKPDPAPGAANGSG